MRQTRILVSLIAAVGFWLALARALPEVNAWAVIIVFFAALPAYLARKKVASMIAQGEHVSSEDRLAVFLSISLFTVPIQLYLVVIILSNLDA
jgi:hypothetical protein